MLYTGSGAQTHAHLVSHARAGMWAAEAQGEKQRFQSSYRLQRRQARKAPPPLRWPLLFQGGCQWWPISGELTLDLRRRAKRFCRGFHPALQQPKGELIRLHSFSTVSWEKAVRRQQDIHSIIHFNTYTHKIFHLKCVKIIRANHKTDQFWVRFSRWLNDSQPFCPGFYFKGEGSAKLPGLYASLSLQKWKLCLCFYRPLLCVLTWDVEISFFQRLFIALPCFLSLSHTHSHSSPCQPLQSK